MSRRKNAIPVEKSMVEVLSSSKKPLTLREIAKRIREKYPESLIGSTPVNSLYSTIYRREIQRVERGHEKLFNQVTKGNTTYYSVNIKGKKFIGERIPT